MRKIIRWYKKTTWWGCQDNREQPEGNLQTGNIYMPSQQRHWGMSWCWFQWQLVVIVSYRWFRYRTLSLDICCIVFGIYPSALLRVSKLHSSKSCARPFLSPRSSNKWRPWYITLAHINQLSCVNCSIITVGLWNWLGLRIWIQRQNILTWSTTTFLHMLPKLQHPLFQLIQLSSQIIC